MEYYSNIIRNVVFNITVFATVWLTIEILLTWFGIKQFWTIAPSIRQLSTKIQLFIQSVRKIVASISSFLRQNLCAIIGVVAMFALCYIWLEKHDIIVYNTFVIRQSNYPPFHHEVLRGVQKFVVSLLRTVL